MPRGPRALHIAFGVNSLTHYGRVCLVHRFLTRIGFKNAVASHLRLAQRNHRSSVGEMLLALLHPIILGLEGIETAELLRQNGVFRHLAGLPRYPEARTLRRSLLRVPPSAPRNSGPSTIGSSTVLVVYGPGTRLWRRTRKTGP